MGLSVVCENTILVQAYRLAALGLCYYLCVSLIYCKFYEQWIPELRENANELVWKFGNALELEHLLSKRWSRNLVDENLDFDLYMIGGGIFIVHQLVFWTMSLLFMIIDIYVICKKRKPVSSFRWFKKNKNGETSLTTNHREENRGRQRHREPQEGSEVWQPRRLMKRLYDSFHYYFSLSQYKIQPNITVSFHQYLKCFVRVICNQFFVLLPSLVILSFMASRWSRIPTAVEQIPPLGSLKVVQDLSVFIIIAEIHFYFSHRLFHQPYFYKRVHKIHHDFNAPIAMASQYAHWLEMLVGNIISVSIGPLIGAHHLAHMYYWVFLSVYSAVVGHSGYVLPWSIFEPSDFHDFHHSHLRGNFGIMGWLDSLFGTDSLYRKLKNSKSNVANNAVVVRDTIA